MDGGINIWETDALIRVFMGSGDHNVIVARQGKLSMPIMWNIFFKVIWSFNRWRTTPSRPYIKQEVLQCSWGKILKQCNVYTYVFWIHWSLKLGQEIHFARALFLLYEFRIFCLDILNYLYNMKQYIISKENIEPRKSPYWAHVIQDYCYWCVV